MTIALTSVPRADAIPDYAAIKRQQQAIWNSGDYAVIGTTLQIVGERLCEAIDLRAGEFVLDVAAGNGNATLAAARRGADVISTDYVPALLDRAQDRANAEHLAIKFHPCDAEALPCSDSKYDVVLSTFGVMFTPHQEQAARELTRVVRRGGRIGLASWTPEGFIGQLLAIMNRHVPQPAGLKSAALWGTHARLSELFPDHEITATKQIFNFRYRSARNWLDVFKASHGPTHRAFAALDAEKQAVLEADILELLTHMNRGGSDKLIVPGEYLEAVIVRP